MTADSTHINLTAQNLSVGYSLKKDDLVLLSNLNFQINSPKLIGIIGKNGVGKSTLLRSLAGLQTVLKGTISLSEEPIENMSRTDWAKKVSVVLTDFPPDCIFTVFDIVSMGRQVHTNWMHHLQEKDKEIIEKAIDITNIQALVNKKFYELSDGQRQKVMIARVLAQDTPIILLDEPSIHLDVNHSMEMFLLFKKLVNEHQKIVLLTTHEIGLTTQLADEIWLIDNHKIFMDTTENILKNNLISKTFDTEHIRFNYATGNFEYRNKDGF